MIYTIYCILQTTYCILLYTKRYSGVLVTVISSVYVVRKKTKALLGCAGYSGMCNWKKTKALLGCAGYGVHIWRPDQF